MARARFGLRTAALAAVLAAIPAWGSAGEVIDRIRAHRQVVIAYRDSAVPFSYVVDGQPVGYAIDLCRQIVGAVQRSLALPRLDIQFVPVKPADRLPVIVDGRADLECGSTTSTVKRRNEVEFTVPHFIAGIRIAVRADSQRATLWDFHSRKLASVTGTTGLSELQRRNAERGLNLTVVEAPTHAAALRLVADGSVDGFVMDDVLLRGAIAAQGMSGRIKVIGPYLTVEPLSIVMSKSDHEFKSLVDSEMKRIIGSGDIRAMYDRWFMQPIPPAGAALQIQPSPLLLANWRYPSDFVPQ